jgi:ATP-binding protein involved in chromosome partitioning
MQADSGKPTVVAASESPIANTYKEIARAAAIKIANAALDHSGKFPNIVIQNT